MTQRAASEPFSETFPEIEVRMKRLTPKIDDGVAEAITTVRSDQTRLDSPPADPRTAHPQRRETAVSGETK